LRWLLVTACTGDIFNVYNTSERGLYRFENLPPIEGYVLVYSDELQFSSKVEVKLIPQETVRCRIKYKDKVEPSKTTAQQKT